MATRLLLLGVLLGVAALPGTLRAEEESLERFGAGLTRTDAEQDAMRKARELVLSLLERERPGLKWTPTTEYLRGHEVLKVVLHEPEYDFGSLGKLHRVTVRVELSEANLRKMLKQDNLFRRHLLAAKIVAALVALLTVLTGYIRLEDLTRGYYSGPLRAALAACVLAIGAGLWWVW
jgi:hypothetical protein